MPASEAEHVKEDDIAKAIHNHFKYKLENEGRQLRLQIRRGRIAMAIGLAFLAACLALREVLPRLLSAPLEQFVGEGLLIVGWVAMWGPLDVFLYGWWPIMERSRLYRRLTQAPIEVRKVD